ncbi:ureidoglycolate dehydrogenase [Microbacterium sp.]|uniref:ureidoglycolate dehydrogenase n=1 Tax=Microbacterium sp. TaxID=51671 RepID=UPI0028B2579F|nr:ureidoglycolate dehydrogenase [Microbacterium sp.]
MRVAESELRALIAKKLERAGLTPEHADIVADVLAYADARGIHSHGAMRTEYYVERIVKGGMNTKPDFRLERTGPSSGIFHGDNASGHVAASAAMREAIAMAGESGIAVVGVRKMAHSGALAYFTEQAASAGFIAISMCQSDPMAVPFGGADVYYGTNPIAFAAPGANDEMISFDMATTVQAWGNILDAQSRNGEIPDDWAVDEKGSPTTDPNAVTALVPVGGPKGYGLAMMVDVLAGILLGLPFGKHVSSMYRSMHSGRDLGQLHIVIDPGVFTDPKEFGRNISRTRRELNDITPAPGFERVLAPGQDKEDIRARYEVDGIDLADSVYDYLVSDEVNRDTYEEDAPAG